MIKYGQPIGHATRDIAKGEHIHTHNLKNNLSGTVEYTYTLVQYPVAEGKQTQNEENGFEEISILKDGVTL